MGSFTLTGNAASVHRGYSLNAEAGHFLLTGQPVEFSTPQPYLPAASAGLNHTFVVRDEAHYVAHVSDTIYDGASTGTVLRSTQKYSTLTPIGVDRGKWFIAKKTGVWSLT